jgi:hypothetical protein
MLRPDFARWDQTPAEILRLSTESAHHRERERYLALYMIGTEQTNATHWAQTSGRQKWTVMNWVHAYNEKGPEGIRWRHNGGRRPLFAQKQARRS